MKSLYSEFRQWEIKNYRGGDGILIGCDITQEWLLKWWWSHYSKHNSYPVTWIDFGLSESMKNWCKERGELIAVRIVPELFMKPKEEIDPRRIASWEKTLGTYFWQSREAWFKKPFAFLRTPYERTIWIDCDCEVRRDLKELFDQCDPEGVAIRRETKILRRHYNSGVVVYRWGHPLFEFWAKWAMEKNEKYFGDDPIIAALIFEKKTPLRNLLDCYNRLYGEGEEGATIFHWYGEIGKRVLQFQLMKENLKEQFNETLS